MIVGFTFKNDLVTKINVLCRVNAMDVSDTEFMVLYALVKGSYNLELTLTKAARNSLCLVCDIKDSNLSTILYRLTDKGLIARQNKTIILNPMFKDLDQLTGVLVKFE